MSQASCPHLLLSITSRRSCCRYSLRRLGVPALEGEVASCETDRGCLPGLKLRALRHDWRCSSLSCLDPSMLLRCLKGCKNRGDGATDAIISIFKSKVPFKCVLTFHTAAVWLEPPVLLGISASEPSTGHLSLQGRSAAWPPLAPQSGALGSDRG